MADYRYYLGPWLWTDDGESPAGWRAPDGTRGLVDLATMGEQAENESAAGSLRRIGFFATTTDLGAEYTRLGRGDCREIPVTGFMREAWESVSGYRPLGDWLVDLLWDQLTNGSDPVGGIAVKPLLPSADRLELHLGGHSLVKRQLFELDSHPHRGRVLDTLRQDFAELFEAAEAGRLHDREHHRRVLDVWCVQFGTADWRQFVPPRLRAHVPGRLPHATTHADNFNRTAGNLDGSTASGGGTWAESEGGAWETDGSAARVNSISNDDYAARLELDLSGSNHYCQLDITASTTNGRGGPSVRHSTSAQTMYYLYCRPGQNDFNWWKQVAGTHTQLGSTTGFTYSLPDTARLQVSGSTLEAVLNGTSQGSVTDTAISGHLRCGMYAFVPNLYIDNWSAGDLSLTASAPTAGIVLSGVVSGSRKTSSAPPLAVSLAAVLPSTRKQMNLAPVALNLVPLDLLTRKIVAGPLASLAWTARPPAGGMTVTVSGAPLALNGLVPFLAKRAAVPTGLVTFNSAIPATRKSAAVAAALVGCNAVVPQPRKQVALSALTTTLTAPAIRATKYAPIWAVTVPLPPVSLTTGKWVTTDRTAVALNPVIPSTGKRNGLPATMLALTAPNAGITKRIMPLAAAMNMASAVPTTRKGTMLGPASIVVASPIPAPAKVARPPAALVGCTALLPGARKHTSVSPATTHVLLVVPVLRKLMRLDPAELALSARLWNQVQPWDTFRFRRRGTVFEYQAPGTVFRFGRRRTVFHFRDK